MCRTFVHELNHEQLKTTKELLDIATQHAFGEEAAGATFVLGNAGAATNGGWATPTKATIKGAKGSKKEQKHRPCHVAMVASNGNDDEGVENSSEEFIAVVERDFKR
jgi:hypothetical protein